MTNKQIIEYLESIIIAYADLSDYGAGEIINDIHNLIEKLK